MKVGYALSLGIWGFFIIHLLSPVRGRTLDQLMRIAQRDSAAGGFIQDNNTVLVELDIMYKAEDWEALQNERISVRDVDANEPDAHARHKRKAINYESKRWTNRVIPYHMHNVFSKYLII